MNLADATWALIDTETSGIEKGCDLLEVAVHLWGRLGTEAGPRFSSLVRPTKPVPPEASGVHGLIDEDFEDAPSRADVDAQLRAFVPADAIVVAHNAAFDALVLDTLENDLGNRRWICSERLAHHITPEAPNFKLGTLRYLYGFKHLEVGAAHRADADLVVLAPVFFHLVARYRAWAADLCGDDAARLAKAETVEALIATATRPYVMLAWPTGPDEARGKPFDQIDAGLLRWGLGKFDGDLKWNIQRELDRRQRAAQTA